VRVVRSDKTAKGTSPEEQRAQAIADLRSSCAETTRPELPETQEQARAKAELHRLVFSRDPPLSAGDRHALNEAIAEVERLWPRSKTKAAHGTLGTLLEAARLLLEDDE
jgi:hypothetical protein